MLVELVTHLAPVINDWGKHLRIAPRLIILLTVAVFLVWRPSLSTMAKIIRGGASYLPTPSHWTADTSGQLALHLYTAKLLPECLAQAPKRRRTAAQISPVRLVLSISKSRVRVGEEFEIIAYLENLSDRPYYVGNQLPSFSSGSQLHRIKVETFDEKGRIVSKELSSADIVWERGLTEMEKLSIAYTILQSGGIHGRSERGWNLVAPGRYKLVATYYENEAIHWPEEKRSKLPIPVWTQKLTSKPITITVVRK